jgi:hypothetical protein
VDLVVNKRYYANVEEMPEWKLEHLHTEAVHEVRRLEERMAHHDKLRLKYASRPMLHRLLVVRDKLKELLDETLYWRQEA